MAGIGATLPSVHERSKDGSLHPLRPLAGPIPKVCVTAEAAVKSTTASFGAMLNWRVGELVDPLATELPAKTTLGKERCVMQRMRIQQTMPEGRSGWYQIDAGPEVLFHPNRRLAGREPGPDRAALDCGFPWSASASRRYASNSSV